MRTERVAPRDATALTKTSPTMIADLPPLTMDQQLYAQHTTADMARAHLPPAYTPNGTFIFCLCMT